MVPEGDEPAPVAPIFLPQVFQEQHERRGVVHVGVVIAANVGVRPGFVAELPVRAVRDKLARVGELHASPAVLVRAAERHDYRKGVAAGQGLVALYEFQQVRGAGFAVLFQVAAHHVNRQQPPGVVRRPHRGQRRRRGRPRRYGCRSRFGRGHRRRCGLGRRLRRGRGSRAWACSRARGRPLARTRRPAEQWTPDYRTRRRRPPETPPQSRPRKSPARKGVSRPKRRA